MRILIKDLKVGDRVLVANGIIILQVRELKGNDAICDVIAGGTLSDRKSMNFPNKVMKHAFLSEQDKDDLLFGIKKRGGLCCCIICFYKAGCS